MKFLFDLFPVILFFAAFKAWDIYVATGVAIVATFGQIGWVLLRRRRVDPMLWTSLGIIVVFGGATLLLRDETFIKWKPTVLYWLFALVLSGAMLGWKRNLIRNLLGQQVRLPDHAWATLLWSWAGFFACMGGLNLFVAFHYSTDTWVTFKLFGGIGLMVAFVFAQALYLQRHVQEEEPKPGDPAP